MDHCQKLISFSISSEDLFIPTDSSYCNHDIEHTGLVGLQVTNVTKVFEITCHGDQI